MAELKFERYAFQVEASEHPTIWGKETWGTEISNKVLNGQYAGKTLAELVEYGEALLGKRAMAIFGQRFPLLAKFIVANTQLSVQVHPNDLYAAAHEQGKLG